MMLLTVKAYNAAEAEAIVTMPNRIIELVGSVSFARLSYPVRIDDNRAAARYVDVMHETRFAREIEGLLGGITDEELQLVCDINKQVAEMTEQLYGRRLFTTGSVIRALNVFRHLRMIYPGRTLTVLEVGPGSGYLGALLLRTGNKYIATDVTQAMYIYQSHLWTHILPGRFYELATEDYSLPALLEQNAPMGIHLPWWKYLTLYQNPLGASVDVVTANHVLCEMPEYGRVYTLKLARQLLSDSTKEPTFTFEGWGFPEVDPFYVYRQFMTNEFKLRHEDTAITVFEPVALDNKQHRSHFQRCTMRVRRLAERFLRKAPSPPRRLVEPEGPYTDRILTGRHGLEGKKVHSAASVSDALKKVLGVENLSTPDEEFCAFVGQRF